MKDNFLYGIELHQQKEIMKDMTVMRVPGGWIYMSYTEQVSGHWSETATFVPFNNEFQGLESKEK